MIKIVPSGDVCWHRIGESGFSGQGIRDAIFRDMTLKLLVSTVYILIALQRVYTSI